MEESIGRCPIEGETVHHRNGVRSDNRIRNLELWTRPQPTRIRVQDAIECARRIIELYDNREVISSPTTTEANLGNPWRCRHPIRTRRYWPLRRSPSPGGSATSATPCEGRSW
ncbi:MAG: HNH endonuclease [Acidimicrobiales bacterium]